jgi:hypothetical protein
MNCPTCGGSGTTLAFFAVRSGGRCDPCRPLRCYRCAGAGTVPDEMREWIAAGALLKEGRRRRNMTLRQEAARRRIPASALAAMEAGRESSRFAIDLPASAAAEDEPEEQFVYAVTTYRHEPERHWPWLARTVGLFPNEESAELCMEENQGDLDEGGRYGWAVVEQVPLGLYPVSAESAVFFRFDRGARRWIRLEAKPPELPDGLASFHTVG